MAKASKDVSSEGHELKPEMRELLLSFDAKDRRDEDARKSSEKSKKRRRRSDKPAAA